MTSLELGQLSKSNGRKSNVGILIMIPFTCDVNWNKTCKKDTIYKLYILEPILRFIVNLSSLQKERVDVDQECDL